MFCESDTPSPNAVILQILIAEDDAGITELLQRIVTDYFTSSGRRFECLTANTVEEAQEVLKRKCFDVIFLDLDLLGGIDALELIREIRQQEGENQRPRALIICTASRFVEGLRAKVEKAGANEVIFKPFDTRHIKQELQRIH